MSGRVGEGPFSKWPRERAQRTSTSLRRSSISLTMLLANAVLGHRHTLVQDQLEPQVPVADRSVLWRKQRRIQLQLLAAAALVQRSSARLRRRSAPDHCLAK